MERSTRQKKILEEEIGRSGSFFDARMLHANASRRDRKIGIATVYRFLKRKVKEGKLHSYLCGSGTTYSGNMDNHSHFICKCCGQRQHINIKKLDFISKEWNVCHVQIDVTGICRNCLKQRENGRQW